MKLFKLAVICLLVSNLMTAQIKLENQIDSVSYSLGADVGDKLKQGGIKDVNIKIFAEAMQEALSSKQLQIEQDERYQLINNYFMSIQNKLADENKKAGEKFLEENKKKVGVVVTESGLQYKILIEGTGAIPADTNKVRVHYHGTLIDGTVFDSSVDRGEPAEFLVNAVIKGWQEVLQLMPVGSRWKVFIPTELAYGTQVRSGGKIEPNMTLIFDIELIDIIDNK